VLGGGGGTQAPVSSLFDLRGSTFRVGVPIPDVKPILGRADRERLGAANAGSEVRFPIARIAF